VANYVGRRDKQLAKNRQGGVVGGGGGGGGAGI